jgi:glycine hydroxymethyltransferase
MTDAAEVTRVAHLIADTLDAPADTGVAERVRTEVKALCARFPVYGA